MILFEGTPLPRHQKSRILIGSMSSVRRRREKMSVVLFVDGSKGSFGALPKAILEPTSTLLTARRIVGLVLAPPRNLPPQPLGLRDVQEPPR